MAPAIVRACAAALLVLGTACSVEPEGPARVGTSRSELGCAESKLTVAAGQISASASDAASSPALAFDGSIATVWNSGGPPPQWIEVDLGAAVPLTRIRLAVEQSPAGATTHAVSVSVDGAPARDVNVVSGQTESGQWLELPILHRVQKLRVSTNSGPSWVAWQEIELFQDASIAPEYFGYYCSGCSWVGNGNYTAATADHSNLIWIADDPVEDVTARIAEGAALGMRSVVSLSGVFFAGSELAPGYQASWDAYAAALGPYVESIAAFYPRDEPDLGGFSDATLAMAIATIKATFPTIPVGVIYSPLTVGGGAHPGIGSYDWVGIDCYSAGGYACGATAYEDAYYELRGLLDKSRQRTMLVPQAGLPVGTPDSAADALALEIDRYVSLAHRDVSVAAIVPFIYQTFDDGAANWNGLEVYPTLRAKFASVGLALQADYAAATAICEQPDGGVGGSGAGGTSGGGAGAGAGAAGGNTGAGGGTAGGIGGSGPSSSSDDSDCGCRLPGREAPVRRGAALLVGGALLTCARARRRAPRRPSSDG